MAECCDKSGILPARSVPSALEAVDAAIRTALRNRVTGKILECSQRHLKRMLIEPSWAAVVMLFAGREVTDQSAKPVQQGFGELVRAEVERQPVKDLLVNCFRLSHCHDSFI